jgi:peptidoglycan/LPS O-acetylase OafA/YrhL
VGVVFAVCLATGAAARRLAGSDPAAAHRDRYLDGLRAVAAVSVLASHFGPNIAGSLGFAATGLFHNLGTFGVQVFFAITGLLFTRKAVAARGQLAVAPFALARVRRIVPMYSLAIALSVLIACVAQRGVPTGAGRIIREAIALYGFGFVQNGAPSIRGLPYVEVIGTIWSLSFEWAFYALVPLLAVIVQSRRWLTAAAAALAAYYGNQMCDGAADVFMPFFLPGIVMGLLPRISVSRQLRHALTAVAVVLAVCAIGPGRQGFTAIRLATMTLLFAAAVLAEPRVLTRPDVAFVGDISYSVYLLHYPVLFVTRALLDSPPIGLFAPYPRALVFAGMAALVIAASALTFRCVEQPFMRRGRSVAAATAPSTALTT